MSRAFISVLVLSGCSGKLDRGSGCPQASFLFDPPEAWSSFGTLPVPTPSGGNGAQGRSMMPKAPRSGGSEATVIDGPEHRGTPVFHRAASQLPEEATGFLHSGFRGGNPPNATRVNRGAIRRTRGGDPPWITPSVPSLPWGVIRRTRRWLQQRRPDLNTRLRDWRLGR